MQLKIFVISLERSVARRQRISMALSSMGLAFEIVEAIDGNLLPSELLRRCADRRSTRHGGGHAFLPGEIGCALSHVRCARLIGERGLPGAIILEDDAMPLPPLTDFARDFPAHHPNYRPGSMIFLGGLEDERPGASDRGGMIVGSLHRKIQLAGGLSISRSIDSEQFFLRACAYYLDGVSAKRLAAFNAPPRTVADDWRLFTSANVIESIYFPDRWAVRHPFEHESTSLLEPERRQGCTPSTRRRNGSLSSINRQVKQAVRRPLRQLLALLR